MAPPTDHRRGPSADFADWLKVIFFGREGWLMVLDGFFDETGTHKGSPVTCVGGYLFTPEQAVTLSQKWTAALNRPDLPPNYPFSMHECMVGRGPFASDAWATREKREAFVMTLVEAISDTATLGVIAGVHQGVFDAFFAETNLAERLGSRYTLCLFGVLDSLSQHLDSQADARPIEYVFESGCPYQVEASSVLDQIARTPDVRDQLHYHGHDFRSKRHVVILQAADLLIWEWQNLVRAQAAAGGTVRPDDARVSLQILIDKVRHLHLPYNRTRMYIQAIHNHFYNFLPRRATGSS